MPKKGIHPDYHEIVIKTFNKDGSEKSFKCASTYKGDTIIAEANIYNHPAWKDDSKIDTENSVNKIVQKFTKKFNYKLDD